MVDATWMPNTVVIAKEWKSRLNKYFSISDLCKHIAFLFIY